MANRELSFWGWGWADQFPDEAARKGLMGLASAMLGSGSFSLRTPPSLASVSLPPARVLPPEALAPWCSTTARDRASHTYGKSFPDLVRGFAGDFAAAPDFVARPTSEHEVDATLEWCSANKVAAIPFGGGTSVVGGVEAKIDAGYAGAVSIDLRQLDRVVEVDPVSRAARIQAGATGPVLEQQLAAHGFSLRHYPQSFEFSTLGGWIATRAGGHFATLYTHIDDLVESLRMLTPRGVYESRRLPGSGAGPSPDRMMIGSEGIFGVITEAWMRVQARPRWRASASVTFREFDTAVEATRAIAQSGLYPANCRLLDAREAMLHRVSGDGSCVLILGFESADHALQPWMLRALELATRHGGTTQGARYRDDGDRVGGEKEAGSWRNAFLQAPYMFNGLVSIGAVVDTFETACTWDQFAALHAAITESVQSTMTRVCGGGFLSCRFTHVYPDGPAPYYTFIAPGGGGEELEKWREIKQSAADTLLAHGGTITHHHAVGRMHRPWYDRQRPQPFAIALAAAKQALDPAGILNPGVLLDPLN